MKCGIRILSLTMDNIKNMRHGSIVFASRKKALSGDFDFTRSDIVGVYGQNGTSKTALINGVMILKKLFMQRKQTFELSDFVTRHEKEMKLAAEMLFNDDGQYTIYTYEVTFYTPDGTMTLIKNERLSEKRFANDKWKRTRDIFLIDFTANKLNKIITPKGSFAKLIGNGDDPESANLLRYIWKDSEYNFSFLFSKEFNSYLLAQKHFAWESRFLIALHNFAINDMHVYDNRDYSKMIDMDILPFFHHREGMGTIQGTLSLFRKSGIIDEQYWKFVLDYVKEINAVIGYLIPGMQIECVKLNEILGPQGHRLFSYAFISKKGDVTVPLRLESDGIKKIVMLLTSFIDIYSRPYAFLAIDELDSGIFEYLLGLILAIFSEDGAGQLLFTSHNLRALEVIKDDIIFTTNDDRNRFTRIPNIQKTNNLRKLYIREMFFKNKTIAPNIDQYSIQRAMSRMGDLVAGEKDSLPC